MAKKKVARPTDTDKHKLFEELSKKVNIEFDDFTEEGLKVVKALHDELEGVNEINAELKEELDNVATKEVEVSEDKNEEDSFELIYKSSAHAVSAMPLGNGLGSIFEITNSELKTINYTFVPTVSRVVVASDGSKKLV